jgi:hypothetical protein
MAEDFEFSLGSVETSILGHALGVDVHQFPLRIHNTTIDPARLARLARLVYDELENRRLSVRGRLHRSVHTAFSLLGDNRVTVAISGLDGHGDDIAVLAVSDGAQAVGVQQLPGEDTVRFRLFPDERLVGVLAGVLPPMPAAPGGVLVARGAAPSDPRSPMAQRRQALVEEDLEESAAFGELEIQAEIRPRERPLPEESGADDEALRRILGRERLGGGHIITAARGRHGQRREAPSLGWLDTDLGRHLVESDTGPHGVFLARYIPADEATVAERIRGRIASVY